MTHHSLRGRTSRFASILTGLLLAGSAYAAAPDLGFAQTETGSFLEFAGDQQVFYTAAQLDDQQVNVATVRNPHSNRGISVQIRAITAAAKARTLAVELAPQDMVSFDLQAGAVHLIATSNSMFQLELQGESAEVEKLTVSRVRTGRNPRTNEAIDAAKLGGGGSSSLTTKCAQDWTLTCVASSGCTGLGPFTHPGRIEQEIIFIGNRPVVVLTEVYWNLNTPTGNYTTEAPSGDPNNPYTATWVPGSNDCPVEVTNSVGHTYTVTR